jgi:cholesterol oxidase
VYGYPTLHVADGAAISANLGVNPSLSITAQAERASALWPNNGEPDQRPAQGEPYRRLDPIAPQRPVVPAHAPGALRLPIIEITSGSPAGADHASLVIAPAADAAPAVVDGTAPA